MAWKSLPDCKLWRCTGNPLKRRVTRHTKHKSDILTAILNYVSDDCFILQWICFYGKKPQLIFNDQVFCPIDCSFQREQQIIQINIFMICTTFLQPVFMCVHFTHLHLCKCLVLAFEANIMSVMCLLNFIDTNRVVINMHWLTLKARLLILILHWWLKCKMLKAHSRLSE